VLNISEFRQFFFIFLHFTMVVWLYS